MAASEAAKEGVYLKEFPRDLQASARTSQCDCAATTKALSTCLTTRSTIMHQRTKHIDRRPFYIRELVERGVLEVPYVATAENLANFFTKALDSTTFRAMRVRIMNMEHVDEDPPSSKRERNLTSRGG